MSFEARFPGECAGCGDPFDEGDQIEYDSANEIVASECCGISDDVLDFDPEDDGQVNGYWGAGDYP
jgi:hypothetical protein